MKAGMLISQFSTEAGFGSAAIRYLSDSNVSHVDLVVPRTIAVMHLSKTGMKSSVPLSRCGLLGARLDGGVQLRDANYAKFTRTYLVGAEVPDIHAAYEFAFAQIGKPYNKGAILDFFLHRERAFTSDQASWFCDELNYEIYAAGGLLLLGTRNPLNLTPQEEMLSDHWKTMQAV